MTPRENLRPAAPGPALRWAGTRAFLLDCAGLTDVMRWHAHLLQHPLPGQVDVVAAARTVLTRFATPGDAREAARAVGSLHPKASRDTGGKVVEIPVVYDGADLADVARLTGMSEQAVVDAHTGATWTAAFGGFAPGFAYLVTDGDPLQVPRRDTPRTAVPAGSVALAGAFSAVYPQRSPGGWQLIGRTDALLWDVERESPALIRPGDTVRYRAVRELATVTRETPTAATSTAPRAAAHGLEVEEVGVQALLQDLGRPGLGDLGVVTSGAADRVSAAQANRLVGNAPTEAVVEVTVGQLRLTARGHHVLAVTGAPVSGTVVREGRAQEADDGATEPAVRPVPFCTPFPLYDGERLHLEVPATALRSCVAVRGGLTVQEVLGSRSTDVMSGIGPEPLRTGTWLPVAPVGVGHLVGGAEVPEVRVGAAEGVTELRITPGPRDDWFTAGSLARLTGQTWCVGADSNRVGVRFEAPEEGGALERARTEELASEGVVAGSLQVPHSGAPVLFLADHPVTGGYPVIAVVVPEDLPLAAHLAPGAQVRFTVPPAPAASTAARSTPSGDTP